MDFTPELRREYRRRFRTARVRPERKALVQQIVDSLVAHKSRYERAGGPIGVPWWFVAIVHSLEASQNFHTHLHNGDPLSGRTVHAPPGRPPGEPPFTWVESARDALTFQRLANVGGWSFSRALFRFEGYNGFGYRKSTINIPTPYLWSFSQHYTRGKFVADNVYDPNAVSQQCGAAVLLRTMVDQGIVATA
jgi:lysozyme family protein